MEENKYFETAAEEKAAFEGLQQFPAWKKLVEIIEAQVEGRKKQVLLTPTASLDAIAEENFIKGEAAGLLLVLELPATLIETAEILIADTKESEDES